jgi:hypothetical protein
MLVLLVATTAVCWLHPVWAVSIAIVPGVDSDGDGIPDTYA